MTQTLVPFINEAEFKATCTLVRRYNSAARDWDDAHMRGIVTSLVNGGHQYASDTHRYSKTAGFVVYVAYVRDGCAYYGVSLDADLLLTSALSYDGYVTLEQFTDGGQS